MVTYYHRFVAHLAELATPLYQLLKQDQPFKWEKEQQQAWESIKAALVETPILGFYDPAKETILACDASPQARALGAVLSQVQQDGTE